jgi:phage gp29-like protein
MMPDYPRLLTDASPVYGEVLLPNKFVVHRYRSRSGITPRAGILRPCAYMYLFKNYTIKDWVIFNERFAMPMRVGKFGPGASEADRRTLRSAVFNLGSDAAAVISDSTVIELLESQGKGASADVYERLVDFCDRSVSKAVLGQTLTTEQSTGTYATALVHQMVRQDLLEADAKALARTITMHVIRPLVEFNFGAAKRLPRFTFQHEGKEDLRALAETYGVLVRDVGFDGIPASHIRERFGIPLIEGKDVNGGGR